MKQNDELLCPNCGSQLMICTKHRVTDIPKSFQYYDCYNCKKRWCEQL